MFGHSLNGIKNKNDFQIQKIRIIINEITKIKKVKNWVEQARGL